MIRESPSENKILDEINQSQFIKNHLKDSKVDESLSLNLTLSKKSISNDEEDCISLEDIPSSLRPYFNYGS
jgi:hypothetical protein